MPNESDLKAATSATTTILTLAPHEIEGWKSSSENARTPVRRLSLVRGEDSYEWRADQVLEITKRLSADRGGVLEFLEIAQFIPEAGSTEGDPPPIADVFRPVAHSLTSISLDVPDVGSGTLLGILHSLPNLKEFTIYAPNIRRYRYEGDVAQAGPSMTGKLGLFHLDVGGDNFIKQLLQHPLEYHTIGLSHNKLIDSYNALINASADTLRSLAMHDIGKHTPNIHPSPPVPIPATNTQLQTTHRGTPLQTSPRSHIRRQLLRTFRTRLWRGGNLGSQDDTHDNRRTIHRLFYPLREAPDLVPVRSRL